MHCLGAKDHILRDAATVRKNYGSGGYHSNWIEDEEVNDYEYQIKEYWFGVESTISVTNHCYWTPFLLPEFNIVWYQGNHPTYIDKKNGVHEAHLPLKPLLIPRWLRILERLKSLLEPLIHGRRYQLGLFKRLLLEPHSRRVATRFTTHGYTRRILTDSSNAFIVREVFIGPWGSRTIYLTGSLLCVLSALMQSAAV